MSINKLLISPSKSVPSTIFLNGPSCSCSGKTLASSLSPFSHILYQICQQLRTPFLQSRSRISQARSSLHCHHQQSYLDTFNSFIMGVRASRILPKHKLDCVSLPVISCMLPSKSPNLYNDLPYPIWPPLPLRAQCKLPSTRCLLIQPSFYDIPWNANMFLCTLCSLCRAGSSPK